MDVVKTSTHVVCLNEVACQLSVRRGSNTQSLDQTNKALCLDTKDLCQATKDLSHATR